MSDHLAPDAAPAAILTDFDRTLVPLLSDDARRVLRKQLGEVYERHGLSASVAAGIDDAYALWSQAYWSLPTDSRDAAHAEATKLLTMSEIAGARDAQLFPNVREALASLGARGIRLAIVSSNDFAAIELVLARTKVLERFELVLARADAPKLSDMKPSPRLLLDALSRLRVDRRSALYVGDSPDDMLAAQRASIAGVGVLTGTAPDRDLLDAGASVVVRDFSLIESAFTHR